MASAFSKSNNVGFEGGFSFLGLQLGNGQLSADFSRERFDNQGSEEKFLNESRNRVEWDDVKLVPITDEIVSH